MNGCIYRTKHGECQDPNRGKEYGPLCHSDCTNKHPSNADRIRDMSDEELAELMNSQMCVAVHTRSFHCANVVGGCDECWLDWLKQEAT